jgi:hypothetical protein
MGSRFARLLATYAFVLAAIAQPGLADDAGLKLPRGLSVEEQPSETGVAKVVLVAGSSVYKPGEHEYIGGCAVLVDLLRQTPGVAPVLAIDWPAKAETLAGARAVVMFFDGAEKHALLKGDRFDQVRALSDRGGGIVQLHQVADYPSDRGDLARSLVGAAWEKGFSQRAHWVARFDAFSDHPIFRGVKPFTIDDGWLYKLRFLPERRQVTPLLRTVSPKAEPSSATGDEAIVSWAYERPNGARAFTFTGGHLHKSLADEAYRRFVVNGILWAAHVDIPATGASVAIDTERLGSYLPTRADSAKDKTP